MSATPVQSPFKFRKGKLACLRVYEALIRAGKPVGVPYLCREMGFVDASGVREYLITMAAYGVVEAVGMGYCDGSNRKSLLYRPTTPKARNDFFSLPERYGAAYRETLARQAARRREKEAEAAEAVLRATSSPFAALMNLARH